jgi:hypothetical protein
MVTIRRHGPSAAQISMPGSVLESRGGYYVEFRIMVSSGDELEQDGGFSMDRPT